MQDLPERYFFVHVMKAAGTALMRSLIPHFRPDQVWNPGNRLADLRDEEARHVLNIIGKYEPELFRRLPWYGTRLFSGHMPLLAYRVLARGSAPVRCMTLLREPVQRVMSQLIHDSGLAARATGMSPGSLRLSLEQLYDSPDWRAARGRDYQTRLFCMEEAEIFGESGIPADRHEMSELAVEAVAGTDNRRRHRAARRLVQVQRRLDYKQEQALRRGHSPMNVAMNIVGAVAPQGRPIEIDNSRLALACSRLESVSAIGLSEQPETLLNDMMWRFGWSPQSVPVANTGDKDIPVPSALRKRIVKDNQSDIEFYHYGRKLVAKRRVAHTRSYHLIF